VILSRCCSLPGRLKLEIDYFDHEIFVVIGGRNVDSGFALLVSSMLRSASLVLA
jgi:hypothetical protein